MITKNSFFIRSFVKYPWLIPEIIFAVFLLLGMIAHPLWEDEAGVGNFARNILQFGLPVGWDGVNIAGTQRGIILNGDLINTSYTWLEMYLAAGSFALFGISSFTARLPFFFVSLFILPVLYALTYVITHSKRIAFFTVFIAAFSVPFILFAFRTRYYSLTVVFGMLFLFSALSLHKKGLTHKLSFILSTFFLLLSNYLTFPSLFAAVLFGGWIGKRFALRQYLFYSLIGILCYAPIFLYMQPLIGKGGITFPSIEELGIALSVVPRQVFSLYVKDTSFPMFLILLWAYFLGEMAVHKKSKNHALVFLSLTVFFYLAVIMFVTSITVFGFTILSYRDVRYHLPIFPLLFMVMALLLNETYKRSRYLFAIVFIFTIVNYQPIWTGRILLFDYFYEVTHPFPTPDRVVADYLIRNARDGNTVFSSLERSYEPLLFFLGNKVKFVNRLDRTETRFFPKNLSILPRYVYAFTAKPDWVIEYSRLGSKNYDYRREDMLPQRVLSEEYTRIILPVYYWDKTRPELDSHAFQEIKPSFDEQIFIYKKK